MMIMGESSVKRQRLPIPRHVCLVSHSQDEDEDENGVEYKVYLLDLNLCGAGATADDGGAVGEYTHVLPTFRFHGPKKPSALCLLASTLFIFEGYNGRYLSDGYVNRGKSALRFELFPNQDWDHRVCDMHTSKYNPCAISTPDRKRILVFSTRLILDHVYEDEDEADTDFELYDPWADSWLQLPRLVPSHLHFRNHEFWSVVAYSFIDHHLFFIRLCSGYMFVLDLDSLEKGWEYYQLGYASLLSWIDDYFPTINSKFVFTSEGIYDVRDEAWEGSEPSVSVPQSSFPLTDLEPFELRAAFPSITILHHDTENGVVHWCALKYSTRSYTRLLIDVYVTHLNAKLNTRILRTLQLLIDRHNLYRVEFLPNV